MQWIKFPEKIQKLMDIYEPYIVDNHLREDAPQEAKDALEKVKAWFLTPESYC